MNATYKKIKDGMRRAERRVLAHAKSDNKLGDLYSASNYWHGIPSCSTYSAIDRLVANGKLIFVKPSRKNGFHGGYKTA